MKRERSYNIPHKGLRNALSQLSLLSGNTDYSNPQQVEKLYNLGQDVFGFLTEHAETENTVVLPELEKRLPGASTHDMDDHVKIHEEQHKLEALLKKIHDDVKAGKDASADGEEFYLNFAKFHGEYLTHTNGEERVTQQQLWDHFNEEELMAQKGRILATLPPPSMLNMFKYVIPAQSHAERVGLLSAIKAAAPEPFYHQTMALAGEVLHPTDFNTLKQALN